MVQEGLYLLIVLIEVMIMRPIVVIREVVRAGRVTADTIVRGIMTMLMVVKMTDKGSYLMKKRMPFLRRS